MGDGFRVEPEALRAYSAVVEAQAEQIEQIRSVLASVQLSSDDFGKLPGSGELYGSYEEHAMTEQQNFADLIELLNGTVEGLRYSAESYDEHESDTAAVYGGAQ